MRETYAVRVQASILIGAITLLTFAVASRVWPSAGDWVAVIIILAVGFPHGADDLAVMKRLVKHGPGKTWKLLTGYVLAMVVTLVLWWWAPTLGLLGFLAISAVHFGYDHVASLGLRGLTKNVYALAWGTFVLIAPLAWHPDELLPVLEAMMGLRPEAGVVFVGGVLAAVAGGIVLLLLALRIARPIDGTVARAEVIQLLLLAHCYVVFPSLWGFAFFFISVHATTSVLNQLTWSDGRVGLAELKAFARRGAPYAALAALSIPMALWWTGATVLTHEWLAGFFILISAFTTPHALVIHAAANSFSTNASTPTARGSKSFTHV